MRWTALHQKRGQTMLDFTNTFHTFRIKLGIKDSERHLVLKYRGALHRYIQTAGSGVSSCGDVGFGFSSISMLVKYVSV